MADRGIIEPNMGLNAPIRGNRGLNEPIVLTDSVGNLYRFPFGLWVLELIKSLPPEWRDELCTNTAATFKKAMEEAAKPKIFMPGSPNARPTSTRHPV